MPSSVSLALAVLLTLTGCGNRPAKVAIRNQLGISGLPSASEAAVTPYRFAFSAMVVDARSGTPVSDFAAAVVSPPSGGLAVINALGDRNGVFHVSRAADSGEAVTETLPVIVTAPGYEPLTQAVEVGRDCAPTACSGSRPIVLALQAASTTRPPKLEKLNHALVFLKSQRLVSSDELQDMLASLKGEKVGATLGAMSALLPYVQTSPKPSAFFASLVPLFHGALDRKGSPASPLTGVLTQALRDPIFFEFVTGKKPLKADKSIRFVLSYLQPLIQGLGGGNGEALCELFNSFLKKEGVLGLRDLKTVPAAPEYAPLLPFLDPLVRGLNSEDAVQLAAMLEPLARRVDPAGALKGLLTTSASPRKIESAASAALGLFPSLPNVLGQALGGKQALASGLLQGMLSGQLKELRVVQDLQAVPGVVVSGPASELSRLAKLAAVDRLVPLPR